MNSMTLAKEYHKIVTVFERDPETKFRTLRDGINGARK